MLDDEIGTTDFGAFSTPTVNNSDNKRNANVFNSLDEAKNIDNRSSKVQLIEFIKKYQYK